MNKQPSPELRNYFEHVPSARAALDRLCEDNCAEETLLELVGWLWLFKPESQITRAKCRTSKQTDSKKGPSRGVDPLARKLKKTAASLEQFVDGGGQFFVDVAASERELKKIRHLQKLKNARKLAHTGALPRMRMFNGKLIETGGTFFRPSATLQEHRQKIRQQRSASPDSSLRYLAEQLKVKAELLEAARQLPPITGIDNFDGIAILVKRDLLAYVKQQTGSERYQDIVDLFPSRKDGGGPFTYSALKQWAHENKELFG